MSNKTATSISEVVTSGLCINCGLCEAVTRGRVRMVMTDYGSLRPTPADDFTGEEQARLLSACPGVTVSPRAFGESEPDPIWGQHSSMRYAWAGHQDVRFRAATGGALTALALHLVKSGKVAFVLHVVADPDQPMRSRWTISRTPYDVVSGAGSRYGPVAPLAGFMSALERSEPFAVVAKPCDLNAVHNLSKSDPRVDALCIYRLAMVCGGQSRLKKSQELLREFGIEEQEVSVFRYRGYGNPGLTRVETRDGRAFEKTYLDLWADEAGWQLETRCKLCPDALGEASDVAAADVWPGGGPTGEDAGFNGIIVRSPAGEALVEAAAASGDLILGDAITPRQFDDLQPHQVRKKKALKSRYEGLQHAGFPAPQTDGLRIEALGQALDQAQSQAEFDGTVKRAREGRFSEPMPEV
ncbi:Coenzyme F420 hydrogenase/dehydrogenase, beta subunit C-terminal domain [Pelagibius sp. Alg239-R121]|uniref:Coenzyme F420 hydrogenase/dehydrogenase, beta subunit C-terminal domain n=1 Tax=Pelagibius sp. Alg239-R121 TaxID=2993448 RepID=UPI0024A635BF|nr:Coenzyme F420 hydrogenase/dehydrogenase, beta subunit C-terminal domain [Pelagibius sp. Alg239-R121]